MALCIVWVLHPAIFRKEILDDLLPVSSTSADMLADMACIPWNNKAIDRQQKRRSIKEFITRSFHVSYLKISMNVQGCRSLSCADTWFQPSYLIIHVTVQGTGT